MKLSAPYVVVFCFLFFFFSFLSSSSSFFFFLLRFSDPHTFSSEWGTEALIKSFFN